MCLADAVRFLSGREVRRMTALVDTSLPPRRDTTRCARALDGARTHNGTHTVFEFSEVKTQSLNEECVTLHNNPFDFFYMIKITHFSRFLDFRRIGIGLLRCLGLGQF